MVCLFIKKPFLNGYVHVLPSLDAFPVRMGTLSLLPVMCMGVTLNSQGFFPHSSQAQVGDLNAETSLVFFKVFDENGKIWKETL